MAVLIEVTSVVIKCSVIIEKFPGSWSAFRDAVPNRTLCTDNEIARVGFMTPGDTANYITGLAKHGILYLVDGKARDLVIADQIRGLVAPCDWVEFGRVEVDGDPGKHLAACQMVGSECRQLFTPDDWTYKRSLSREFVVVESEKVPESLQFLRHQDGLDVYLDLTTGEEIYVGRIRPSE